MPYRCVFFVCIVLAAGLQKICFFKHLTYLLDHWTVHGTKLLKRRNVTAPKTQCLDNPATPTYLGSWNKNKSSHTTPSDVIFHRISAPECFGPQHEWVTWILFKMSFYGLGYHEIHHHQITTMYLGRSIFGQSSFRVANPRSYLLHIGPNDTVLRASSIHGMKRGLETLLQVLVTWFKKKHSNDKIPGCCWVLRGWNTAQLCGEYFINHCFFSDPY